MWREQIKKKEKYEDEIHESLEKVWVFVNFFK